MKRKMGRILAILLAVVLVFSVTGIVLAQEQFVSAPDSDVTVTSNWTRDKAEELQTEDGTVILPKTGNIDTLQLMTILLCSSIIGISVVMMVVKKRRKNNA